MRNAILLVALAACRLPAQVTADQLLHAAEAPKNWLTYSGAYFSQRYSGLTQITPTNAKNLEQKWIFQADSLQRFEATPLVVDGIMYATQAPNDVMAIDARTGRLFWIYQYKPAAGSRPCCGLVNRGLAILGDTLYMATVDAHLVAVDARNGKPLWNVEVADYNKGYAMTLAPLAVKDKIIVGAAGGEYGIRGFIAAYDPKTGKEIWKFYTIPGPGEPGHETWPAGDAWMHGGASVWITGSYDPSLNLTYWGVGNPGPDFNPKQRAGDNLYASSVVALDADTGKLKWHFQFTPNDPYDYDSVQIPVLADAMWSGKMRKLMFWANRNGFFYVLDRTNGEFLSGHPFVKVNWASGLDDSGRPVQTPQPEGKPTYPGPMGGTNWYSPSYSPRTGLFYVSAFEDYGGIFHREDTEYKEGQRFSGPGTTPAMPGWPNPAGFRAALINNWTDEVGHGAVIALDIHTGQPKWKYRMTDTTDAGILTTASDVLFTGSHEGFFQVLDARTGALLWKSSVGGQSAAPMTFELDGKQYVAMAAGHALFVYGLRE
jgi:alcohol dehydrogenase (cytochrome c)